MRTKLIAITGVTLVALAGTAAPATAASLTRDAAHVVAAGNGDGMGLNLAAVTAHKKKYGNHFRSFGTVKALRESLKDGSADLSQYANTPGDQGNVNSCVAWATGYTGYGILMNEQNISGGPMAPMFIYSQIAQGNDQGTTASTALPMMQDQGIDTRDDYSQGDFDFTTQPTDDERANAAKYKLSGYDELSTDPTEGRQQIESALNAGHPVPVGLSIHQNFNDMDAQTAADYSYEPSGAVEGGHEVTIVGYNDKGVRIENSWGSGWGDGGYFTLSWDALLNSGDLREANAMGQISATPSDPPSDDPTTPSDPTDPSTDDPTDPSDGGW